MAYGYIKELSEEVERKHVRYNNRYGMAIAADIYTPKVLDQTKKYPALIVGAPYGGVKEQGPCIYADELTQRGYVILTFDQVFMGESSGEPRHISSPDLFAESFSAAVDYIGVKIPYVDRERIGAIGICGSGGFALSAASVDVRIKAVASTSMYDISNIREIAGLTKEQIDHMKKQLCEQRWRDFENGESEYHPNFPEIPYTDEDIPETDSVTNEWNRFYATVRGHHPNALGGFTTTSDLVMLQFKCLDYVEEISPRPVLLIAGDRAHSKSFSEAAYAKAAEPKELYIVEGAEHIDLYDKTEFIPFEKLDDFFKKNL